jgi:hypothetical protein
MQDSLDEKKTKNDGVKRANRESEREQTVSFICTVNSYTRKMKDECVCNCVLLI